jgi:Rrf2 family protein
MLSQKSKYALKALIALARGVGSEPVRIQDLATSENIPHKFLEAILLQLRHAGVLRSVKGPGGGYLLARPAEQVTVGQILRLFDGPLALIACASQTAYVRCADCSDEGACQVRWMMLQVREATSNLLDQTSLAALAQQAEPLEVREAHGERDAARNLK